MSDDKQTLEIIEKPEPVVEKIDLAGLSDEEKVLAEKQGIKDAPVDEKTEDNKALEEDKPVRFEDIEKNEKLLRNYSKSEQAFYWQWKNDKKARQQAQAERDLGIVTQKSLKAELDKAKESGDLTKTKLDKIGELLSGDPEEITIEAIQEILKTEPKKVSPEDKPLTKKDLEEIQKESGKKAEESARERAKVERRVQELEEYGKTQIENYDEVIQAADEVLSGKVKLPSVIDINDLGHKFIKKIQDESIAPDDLVEFVTDIAKLNPSYGKKKVDAPKDGKKVTNDDIDKIVKNAGKASSAAVSTSGKRLVSVESITIEDAAKLSPEQWMKLPKEKRRQLLSQ